jgi:hypothetical protein
LTLISVPDLQAILRPHAGRFGRIVWPIWDRFTQLPDDHRLAYDATTEANILHDYMVQSAKREFTEVPGICFLEQNGFHLGIDASGYGVDGLAVCRFKKLSENGTSCNYPTERAEALRRNEPLPGMPEHATYIDVGYVLNPLRTGFSAVQLVRVMDSQVIFSIPRSGGQVTELNEILPFGPMSVEPRFNVIVGGAKRKADGTNEK